MADRKRGGDGEQCDVQDKFRVPKSEHSRGVSGDISRIGAFG